MGTATTLAAVVAAAPCVGPFGTYRMTQSEIRLLPLLALVLVIFIVAAPLLTHAVAVASEGRPAPEMHTP